MTRPDTPASNSRAPLTHQLVEPAPTRAGRARKAAQRPELRRLLQRTLAALDGDLAELRAAELSRAEVVAFLENELAAAWNAAPALRGASPSGAARAGASAALAAAQSELLGALRQLERESPAGALLSVRELRARTGLDKAGFDRAALELAAQGRVSLHAHDHAGVLPELERRALVEDARGVHYVGIASIPDARHEVSL